MSTNFVNIANANVNTLPAFMAVVNDDTPMEFTDSEIAEMVADTESREPIALETLIIEIVGTPADIRSNREKSRRRVNFPLALAAMKMIEHRTKNYSLDEMSQFVSTNIKVQAQQLVQEYVQFGMLGAEQIIMELVSTPETITSNTDKARENVNFDLALAIFDILDETSAN